MRLDGVAIVKLRCALQLDDGKGGAVIRGGEGMGCLPEQRPVFAVREISWAGEEFRRAGLFPVAWPTGPHVADGRD